MEKSQTVKIPIFHILSLSIMQGGKNRFCKKVFQLKIQNSKLEVNVLKHLSNNIQKTMNSEKKICATCPRTSMKKEKEKLQVRRQS